MGGGKIQLQSIGRENSYLTKNPQIKKRNVLNIKPISAETVDSAIPTLVMLIKSTKLNAGVVNFFIIFPI